MADVVFHKQLNVPRDDATVRTGYYANSLNVLYVGDYSASLDRYRSILHVPDIFIPKGATLTNAYISLRPLRVEGNAPTVGIFLEKTQNASRITSSSQYDNLTQTNLGVAWRDSFDKTQHTISPDIKAVIQEIVNTGNVDGINIILKNPSEGWSGARQRVAFRSADSGTNYNQPSFVPIVHIEYLKPDGAKYDQTPREVSLEIIKGNHDGSISSTSNGPSRNLNYIYLGDADTSHNHRSYFYFPNVNVPSDALIERARLHVHARRSNNDNIPYEVSGALKGNVLESTIDGGSLEELEGGARTSRVQGVTPNTSANTDLNLDIKQVVEEIIANPDWVRTNSMLFFLEKQNKNNTNSGLLNLKSFDLGGGYAPSLEILFGTKEQTKIEHEFLTQDQVPAFAIQGENLYAEEGGKQIIYRKEGDGVGDYNVRGFLSHRNQVYRENNYESLSLLSVNSEEKVHRSFYNNYEHALSIQSEVNTQVDTYPSQQHTFSVGYEVSKYRDLYREGGVLSLSIDSECATAYMYHPSQENMLSIQSEQQLESQKFITNEHTIAFEGMSQVAANYFSFGQHTISLDAENDISAAYGRASEHNVHLGSEIDRGVFKNHQHNLSVEHERQTSTLLNVASDSEVNIAHEQDIYSLNLASQTHTLSLAGEYTKKSQNKASFEHPINISLERIKTPLTYITERHNIPISADKNITADVYLQNLTELPIGHEANVKQSIKRGDEFTLVWDNDVNVSTASYLKSVSDIKIKSEHFTNATYSVSTEHTPLDIVHENNTEKRSYVTSEHPIPIKSTENTVTEKYVTNQHSISLQGLSLSKGKRLLTFEHSIPISHETSSRLLRRHVSEHIIPISAERKIYSEAHVYSENSLNISSETRTVSGAFGRRTHPITLRHEAKVTPIRYNRAEHTFDFSAENETVRSSTLAKENILSVFSEESVFSEAHKDALHPIDIASEHKGEATRLERALHSFESITSEQSIRKTAAFGQGHGFSIGHSVKVSGRPPFASEPDTLYIDWQHNPLDVSYQKRTLTKAPGDVLKVRLDFEALLSERRAQINSAYAYGIGLNIAEVKNAATEVSLWVGGGRVKHPLTVNVSLSDGTSLERSVIVDVKPIIGSVVTQDPQEVRVRAFEFAQIMADTKSNLDRVVLEDIGNLETYGQTKRGSNLRFFITGERSGQVIATAFFQDGTILERVMRLDIRDI